MMGRHDDPRDRALRVIEAVERGGELQQALNRALSRSGLSGDDRHLATQLCYGYFRFKGRLAFIVSSRVSHSWRKLPRPLRTALLLAGYELLHLDRVPDYATVSWYVQRIKERHSLRLAGLANAVLRNLAAEDRGRFFERSFYSRQASEEAEVLSRFYSCPRWIVELWLEHFGRETCEELLRSSLDQPPVGLRINQTLPEAGTVRQGFLESPDCLMSRGYGLALIKASATRLDNLASEGLLSRQSLAAQEAVLELAPETWPEPIWDACAGRGGKTGLLRELGHKEIWASDVDWNRLRGLPREMDRLQLKAVPAFLADASGPHPFAQRPQCVLLDVPCTGLGVISRRPDLKWKRRPDDVQSLAKRQLAILTACTESIRVGGRVIYITCTISPEENEELIKRFLKTHAHCFLEKDWATSHDSPLREHFYAACLRIDKV